MFLQRSQGSEMDIHLTFCNTRKSASTVVCSTQHITRFVYLLHSASDQIVSLSLELPFSNLAELFKHLIFPLPNVKSLSALMSSSEEDASSPITIPYRIFAMTNRQEELFSLKYLNLAYTNIS